MTLLVIGTLTALVVFGLLLWIAIMSIDGAMGINKTSPDAPESLASLGAPRSQLGLERMFASMRSDYDENGLAVCEPITADYRRRVNERISAGESSALSVEEILYIISDSIAIYDTCDVVRLMRPDGGVEAEIEPIKDLAAESVPYHLSAKRRTSDILSIIRHRIFALSSSDVMTETPEGCIYIPEYTEREGARSFTISDEIAFNTESGRPVRLYPTERLTESENSTVLVESKRALGRAEREVLFASGYDADACRNVTPEYMYGKTDIRLVALGGRILVVDVYGYIATDIFPKDERLSSVALSESGIYVTGEGKDGSSLRYYERGVGERLVAVSEEKCIGVYDDGETLGLYVAEKHESKTYITVLVRTGESIMTIEK